VRGQVFQIEHLGADLAQRAQEAAFSHAGGAAHHAESNKTGRRSSSSMTWRR